MTITYSVMQYDTSNNNNNNFVRLPWRWAPGDSAPRKIDGGGASIGKGQMGSALMGSLHFYVFLAVLFLVLPLTYFDIPKSARTYLLPQSGKNHDFGSGSISVDPICRNQDYS